MEIFQTTGPFSILTSSYSQIQNADVTAVDNFCHNPSVLMIV